MYICITFIRNTVDKPVFMTISCFDETILVYALSAN